MENEDALLIAKIQSATTVIQVSAGFDIVVDSNYDRLVAAAIALLTDQFSSVKAH